MEIDLLSYINAHTSFSSPYKVAVMQLLYHQKNNMVLFGHNLKKLHGAQLFSIRTSKDRFRGMTMHETLINVVNSYLKVPGSPAATDMIYDIYPVGGVFDMS